MRIPRFLTKRRWVWMWPVLLIAQAQVGALAQDSSSLVAKGEYLARAGDCIACHTAPGDKLFAGRRAMLTPFGTLYTSNITPDPETGIGNWTPDQFYGAMHTGRFPGWRPPISGDAVWLLYKGDARG